MLVKRIQSNMTGWMRDPQWEKRFSPVQRVRDNDITMICSVISDVLAIYVLEVRASINSIKLSLMHTVVESLALQSGD